VVAASVEIRTISKARARHPPEIGAAKFQGV